jgi:signal transduction histidine kinase
LQTERDSSRLLRSFLDVSLQLTQELDLISVLKAIVERSMELTGARYGAAATLGPDGIEQFIHRGLTPDQVKSLPHLPVGRGLLGEVIATRAPVRVDRIADHSASVGFPSAHVAMEAFLGVPFLQRNELVGALYLTKHPGETAFSPEDEEICLSMGSMAAVAIVNARLFATETERAERADALRDIAMHVRHSLDVDEVLEATCMALGRAAHADRCFIRMATEPGSPELDDVMHEWTAPGVSAYKGSGRVLGPVTAAAARTLTTQWTSNIDSDPRFERPPEAAMEAIHKAQTSAILSTPLEWGGELLGVVTFHSLAPREWTRSDIRLIEAAAREVTAALDHARLYEEALKTADRLRELDRLRADFMAMVSHELRSPMTVVGGTAHLLQWRREELRGAEMDELFETLERESRRLTRLVSEFLDMEAIESGRMTLTREPVDLLDLAAEAMIDSGCGARTDLETEPGDTLVQADRDRIKQILLNLIGNAAKYSGSDLRITVRVLPSSDSVVVSVHDRGPGIPEEEKAHLFERFSRLSSTLTRAPGSGIGLFVSRTIVQMHGGEIWVESGKGEGATFAFELPRASRRTRSHRAASVE